MFRPKREFFFFGTKEVIPRGRDGPILPARVANQNTDFTSFFPRIQPYNNVEFYMIAEDLSVLLFFAGLAFSTQLCNELPVTERDMTLDHVISFEPD